MSCFSRAATTAALIATLVSPLAFPHPTWANTFACCLPDGSCQDTLIMTCDDLGGASLVGRNCSDSQCRSAAPLLSPLGLLGLLTAFSAVAIHGLRRRRSAAQ
jgi:hypothetical protein